VQRVGRAGGLAEGQLGIGDGVQLARVLRSSAWAQRIARAGLAKVACIPITGALDVAAPKPANLTAGQGVMAPYLPCRCTLASTPAAFDNT
jgi:hypothetical protein